LLIQRVLRVEVIRAVRRYLPAWPDNRIRNNVSGLLAAENTLGHGNSIHFENNMLVRHIDADTLEELLITIHQSNDEIEIYDLELTFTINPNSLIVGQGTFGKPSWLKTTDFAQSWKTFEGPDGFNVSCAAIAITIHIAKYGEFGTGGVNMGSDPKREKALINTATDLQKKLQWNCDTSISDLANFPYLYPTWRLVVVIPYLRNYSQTAFVHPSWKAETAAIAKLKSIYLLYDESKRHFGLIRSPEAAYRQFHKSDSWKFCHKCLSIYDRSTTHVNCKWIIEDGGDRVDAAPKHKSKSARMALKMKNEHYCNHCALHAQLAKSGVANAYNLRCPLQCLAKITESEDLIDNEAIVEEEYRTLIIYDIESAVVKTLETYTAAKLIEEFVDEDAIAAPNEDDGFNIIRLYKSEHRPNLLVWCNMDTPDDLHEETDIATFVRKIMDMPGKITCLAHYASGYDSRLIFNVLKSFPDFSNNLSVINRGSKFMRMQVNPGGNGVVFQDSLLHMGQSLRSLAKDFNVPTKKGFFPHLFNNGADDHNNYIGPIPPVKWFDHRFSFKHKDLEKRCEEHLRECVRSKPCDYHEFLDWHSTFEGDWNFRHELRAYCRDDVKALAQVCKKYHDVAMVEFKISPWGFATGPSYMHHLYMSENTKHFYIKRRKNMDRDWEDRVDSQTGVIIPGMETKYDSFHESWMVLEAEEYYFAREALRGGRTEIRKTYASITPQQYADGYRIKYIDVVSMYPYNQIVHEYPTGTPTIYVFDDDAYPCWKHWKYPNGFEGNKCCRCTLQRRMQKRNKKLNVIYQPSNSDIINTFFGFITCDVQPPADLYHPVLVTYDVARKKCVASLEFQQRKTFTSVEFHKAREMGYEFPKVYRIDHYNKSPSKWKNIGNMLYYKKMANAAKAPSDQDERIRLEQAYLERFGLDIRGRWGEFDKRPALKAVFKIWNNSGWGKHAETVDHVQFEVIDHNDIDTAFFSKIAKNQLKITSTGRLNDTNSYFQYTEDRKEVRPDTSKHYLPCACFVTAYSRLQLWEELNKHGEDVLMHDTDSIIYLQRPGAYETPSGIILGEWEEEKVSKKGIVEFVGLGPKSYGLKFADGSSTFKIKGVSAKQATEQTLGYQVMKDLVLGVISSTAVPQMSFDYRIGQPITTRYFVKIVKFQEEDIKGQLRANKQIYPFGWWDEENDHEMEGELELQDSKRRRIN